MAITYSTPFNATVTEALNVWSAADWRQIYIEELGIRVEESTDRLEIPYSGTTSVASVGRYRLIAAGQPTGDQEVSLLLVDIVAQSRWGVMLRMPTDDADSGYLCALHNAYGVLTLKIFRVVVGVLTEIATSTAITPTLPLTLVASAIGTNPVALSVTLGATTVTFDDAHADRRQSGTPGVGGHQLGESSGANIYADDYVVDNLASGGTGRLVSGALLGRSLVGGSLAQ